MAILLAHLPQIWDTPRQPGIRILRQSTSDRSAGSSALVSPNLATSHQFRRFAGLTARRTWNFLNLYARALRPSTSPFPPVHLRRLRKGAPRLQSMPIIYFFPGVTSQQASEWLILGVNVAEWRCR